MKIFKKKAIKRTLALAICTLLLFTDSYIVKAAETTLYSNDIESEQNNISLDSINEQSIFEITQSQDTNVQGIYDDLTDEAKYIFLSYIRTDAEMYAYHLEHVDPNAESTYSNLTESLNEGDLNLPSDFIDTSKNRTSSALSLTQTLSNNLNAIPGLTEAVKYALMGVGSSIIAIGSQITVAQLVGLLVAAACSAVLIANWDIVSSHWDEIVSAFKTSFSSLVNGSNISTGFANAKPTYVSTSRDINEALGTYRNGYAKAAFSKHIDSTYTLDVIRRRNPLNIYYSPAQRKVLMVYSIPNGQRANVNIDFNPHTQWESPNCDISGAKLFILYSLNDHSYFHAHIRLFKDDTEQMRYANKLSWHIYPNRIYDEKYEVGGNPYLNGTIYSR